jgi:hypothetical protein
MQGEKTNTNFPGQEKSKNLTTKLSASDQIQQTREGNHQQRQTRKSSWKN